jgi:hypothetical protein
MKFFIPGADSPESEERIYEAIKSQLSVQLSDRRIRLIRWRHDGRKHEAEVGRTTSLNNEQVIAIFYDERRRLYHICTPNRCARGGAILAGEASVIGVIEFNAN